MAVTGSFYGRDRFDPLLILAQIVLLQACFYGSYLILLVIFNRATGTTAKLADQIFNNTLVTLRHFPGWVTCSALILSAAGPTALAFTAIVGRAKRCVDFACTLLISHTIACTVHSGFPKRLMWWMVNVLATVALSLVGEALSMRVELREISVNSRSELPLPSTMSDPSVRREARQDARSDEGGRVELREGASNVDVEKAELIQSAA